jgi:hypothetical protein
MVFKLKSGLLVLVFLSTSCSMDEQTSLETGKPWETSEEEGYDLTSGLYKISLRINNDSCKPSIKDITDRLEHWPPKYSVFSQGHEPDWGPTMNLFNIRIGEPKIETDYGKWRTVHEPLFSQEWWRIGGWTYVLGTSCLDGYQNDEYVDDLVTARVVSPTRVEVDYDYRWPETWDKCVRVQGDSDVWRWQPKQPCTESYTLVYDLIEECRPENGSLSNSYGYFELPGPGLPRQLPYISPQSLSKCKISIPPDFEPSEN